MVEGVLTFKICIGHFLLGATVWVLDPRKCYFCACPVAKSDISRAPATSVIDLAIRYECQTIAWTKLVNVCLEHFFASV